MLGHFRRERCVLGLLVREFCLLTLERAMHGIQRGVRWKAACSRPDCNPRAEGVEECAQDPQAVAQYFVFRAGASGHREEPRSGMLE